MKKLTGALVGLAFLLCAFTVQAAQGIDVSVPSVGEACSETEDCGPGELCIDDICSAVTPCSNDLDCAAGELCIDDICSVVTPCSNDLDCADDELCIDDICSVVTPCSNDLDCAAGEECIDEICLPSAGDPCSSSLDCADDEVCIDEICVQGECESDADCDDGQICTPVLRCVECLSIADCPVGDYCSEGMCEQSDDCDVRFKPRHIKISKMQKKNEKRSEEKKKPFKVSSLKIAGNENFDPNGVIDTGAIDMAAPGRIEIKKKSVKFVVYVGTDLDLGFYPISVGSCVGELPVD
jgi:hypothetical protein